MHHAYKTARCVLYRGDEYLLAIHSSFWGFRHQRWGLPGGRIERGETPASAVARELAEELEISDPNLLEVGPFPYKSALHMVFAAEVDAPISSWDQSELLDVRWFSEPDVVALRSNDALHANYELEAIRALRQKLGV